MTGIVTCLAIIGTAIHIGNVFKNLGEKLQYRLALFIFHAFNTNFNTLDLQKKISPPDPPKNTLFILQLCIKISALPP